MFDIARLYLRWPFREYLLLLLVIVSVNLAEDCDGRGDGNLPNQVLYDVACWPGAQGGHSVNKIYR